MPTIVEQLISRASQLSQMGQLDESLKKAFEAIDHDPRNTTALFLAANTAYKLGDAAKAVELVKRVVEIEPENADAWYNLGMFHNALNDPKASMEAHKQALTHNPEHVDALVNFGGILGRSGYFETAFRALKLATRLDPTSVVAANTFANVLKEAGLNNDALKAYERTINLNPNLHGAYSNVCYLQQFNAAHGLRDLHEIHQEWGKRFCDPCTYAWPAHQNEKDPDRPLRVGFISEDFRHHTVGHYLIDVFEHLPPDIEPYCYSLSTQADDVTDRFRARAHVYADVATATDDELFDRIMADQIDVLFDLSGHTSGNRLRMLCRKPAPVQLSWLGYVGTLGIKAIDYVIASHASVPEGSEYYFTEGVLRFPAPYPHQCYSPGCFGEVEIGPVPSEENGYVTYGSFSNISKLNPEVIVTWSKILMRDETSRLLLKSSAFKSEFTCKRIRDTFEVFGVGGERILLEPFTPPPAAFETYNKIDVVLDPWPFSGCTTTCEALWMGVPIVTKPGASEASRHTTSFLVGAGLIDSITSSVGEYVSTAVRLGADTKRRTHLRQQLRPLLLSSPVCDAEKYGHMLSDLIRQAWKEWCG